MSVTPVHAPVVAGSGVAVVHRSLEKALPGYSVEELSPYLGALPPILQLRERPSVPVVHSHPELGAAVAHPDAELVTTFHNYYLDSAALAWASVAQRAYYRCILKRAVADAVCRARWVTAVSHFTANLIRRHYKLGERLVVIRNGVDTSIFSPSLTRREGPARILFAGNPIRRKGIEHLEALAGALPTATIIYTSGLRNSLLSPPTARPNLIGLPRLRHADMAALYKDADVLFFPSRREGFGLVVAEAMASGLPVVATACSSLPELVDHGRGGLLFEMDNRDQMLTYLKRLISDRTLRTEMGIYNREKVLSQFRLERMTEDYRQVFAACNSTSQ